MTAALYALAATAAVGIRAWFAWAEKRNTAWANVTHGGEVLDLRQPGEAFCGNCPDHEACMTNWPCSLVKRVNKETA